MTLLLSEAALFIMFKLRDYQQRADQAILDYISLGKRRILYVAPAGSGKGSCIAYRIAEWAKEGKRILFTTHKRNLVSGTNALADRLKKQMNFHDFGYYLSGVKSASKKVMLSTYQTALNRKLDFDVIMIDEAHRTPAKEYQRLLENFKGKIIIGYTASPVRMKAGESFENDFDVLLQSTTTMKLIEQKALVPFKLIAPNVGLDFTGIKIRPTPDGDVDFNQKEVFEKFDNDRIYQAAIDKWRQHCENRQTIVFTTNRKEHAHETARRFNEAGITAKAITSDMEAEEQLKVLKEFEDELFKVLVNISMVSEGVSVDNCGAVMLLCATASIVKYIQATARAARPIWDGRDWAKSGDVYIKPNAIILDLGMNVRRHGGPEQFDVMGFDLTGKPKRDGVAPTKTCPQCDHVQAVQVHFCKNCGYKFEFKVTDDKVHADEVDFAEIDQIDLFIDKVLASSGETIKKRFATVQRPELLRITAAIKGWSDRWAVYAAKTYGYTSLDPNTQYDQILDLLKAEEDESGVWKYHERLCTKKK